MKTFLILVMFAGQVSFAASRVENYSGSTAKIMYTQLLVERSLNGDKSGVNEYNSSSMETPGKPNTQVNTLEKVGAESTISCSEATTYNSKVSISCEISQTQK